MNLADSNGQESKDQSLLQSAFPSYNMHLQYKFGVLSHLRVLKESSQWSSGGPLLQNKMYQEHTDELQDTIEDKDKEIEHLKTKVILDLERENEDPA